MSTELAIYDRIDNPDAVAKSFGLSIHQSGIFGTAAACQGEVLAWECMVRGIPPLMLAERYHIIFGKLSMKYDAMLAGFIEEGGKHRKIERTKDAAEIELSIQGETDRFRFTWEEAQEEPFIYEGKEKEVLKMLAGDRSKLELKAKYRTPRARMQMLWARVVSDGVRTMRPTVNHGTYSPEEVEDFAGEGTEADEQPAPKKARVVKLRTEATDVAADAQVANGGGNGEVVDVEVEAPFDSAAKGESDNSASMMAASAASNLCSADQRSRITELFGVLELTVEQRDKLLGMYKASVVRNLNPADATTVIAKLEGLLAKRQAASQQQAEADSQPCTESTQAAIKAKFLELGQSDPGIAKMIAGKLKAANLTFKQITEADGQRLLGAITGNTVEAFFGASLWPTPKAAQADAKN